MAEVDYRTTGVVTAPISLKAVADLLGEKPDVAAVCKSARINMWAKWKPVMVNKPVPLTDAERRAVRFGVDFGVNASESDIPALFDGGLNSWAHTLPSVRSGWCPFRLSDFVSGDRTGGYDHNAKSPFGAFMVPQKVYYDRFDIDCSVMIKSENGNGLTYGDLGLGGYYPGAVLKAPNGALGVYASENTLSEIATDMSGQTTFRVDRSMLTDGTFTLYPVLFQASGGNGNIVPIPYCSPAAVECTTLASEIPHDSHGNPMAANISDTVQVWVEATYTASTQMLVYTAKWKNTGATDRSIDVAVQLGTDGMNNAQALKTATVTATANGSGTVCMGIKSITLTLAQRRNALVWGRPSSSPTQFGWVARPVADDISQMDDSTPL